MVGGHATHSIVVVEVFKTCCDTTTADLNGWHVPRRAWLDGLFETLFKSVRASNFDQQDIYNIFQRELPRVAYDLTSPESHSSSLNSFRLRQQVICDIKRIE